MSDQRPQPGLQLLLDELVGRGNQCRVLDQPEWPGQLEPGPLVRLDLHSCQLFQGPGPHLREVCFTHRHSPLAPPTCDQQLCPQAVHAGYRGVHGPRRNSAYGRCGVPRVGFPQPECCPQPRRTGRGCSRNGVFCGAQPAVAGLTVASGARNVNRPSHSHSGRSRMRAYRSRGSPKAQNGTWSSCEQAYVPAEQPPACQDARFPAAHADQGRPRRPGRAAAQGPRAPQCLISSPPAQEGKVTLASGSSPDTAACRLHRCGPGRPPGGPRPADRVPAGPGRIGGPAPGRVHREPRGGRCGGPQ